MEEIDLKELLSYFKSKIIWIILIVLIAIVAGNSYDTFMKVPMYKSSTTILLVTSTDEKTTTNSSSYTDLQINKNLVSTYSEIIKSRKVLNTVISDLKLDYSVTKLSNNTSVEAIDDTEIIRISYTDKNSKKAEEIANKIAEVFCSKIQTIYNLNNVTIIDEAIESKEAYNVNILKDNVIFTLIGLVVSCGIVFIGFYFDNTVKNSNDIEKRLGISVLGVVPKNTNKKEKIYE